MSVEEKIYSPAEPGTSEKDKPEAQPDELETPISASDRLDEALPGAPETSDSPGTLAAEVPPGDLETPPSTFSRLAEVAPANGRADSQAHAWRYLITGMALAILAMVLGATLGYLARPALDSASSLAAIAPRPLDATTSVATSSAATPPAAKASTDLIAEVVQTGGHSQGSPDAPVVIVEYSDFQCPYCGRYFKEVESRLKETYVKNGQVRLIYKHYAFLGQESVWAALASECAGEQNKFWEYHDVIFSRQSGENQGTFSPDNLKSWAAELKLDPAAFNQCFDSGKYLDVVQANTQEGKQLGIQGTPGFFVDDVPISGAQPFEVFQQVIEEKLKASGQAN